MAVDKIAVKKNAQKFTAKGQYDKAIAEWKKLLKETPNDANLYNTIGDLCVKKKNGKPEAVDAYKKAADLLAADGFTSKAIALYKKIVNIDPRKIDVHLALADLNAEKGLTGNALESYKKVAEHYSQKKDTVKALGIYQKMADLNPANVAFRMKLGDMYAKEGMKPDATRNYLEAADVHLSKEAFQDARQIFEKVLALDPDNKPVYHKAGIVYYKEGKFVEACKAFKPALEADPDNQELANTYLDALTQADRAAEAVELLKKLLSQDARRTDLREKLYRIYLSNKENDHALSELSTLVESKADDREFDAAEGLIKEFIAANPENVAARRRMSEFYSTIHREEEAAKELLTVADLMIAQGDAAGGKEELIRAVDLDPDLTEAKERLERLDAGQAPGSLEEEAAAAPIIEEMSELEPAPSEGEVVEEVHIGEDLSPLSSGEPIFIEEDPAVDEAITEVDVLAKYGLSSKAIEQLESTAAQFPESPKVRAKLRELYRDQENIQKVVEHAVAEADIYSRKGLQDEGKKVLLETLELAPGDSTILDRLGEEGAAVAPAGEQAAPLSLEESLSFEESGSAVIPEGSLDLQAPAVEWQPSAGEAPEEAAPLSLEESLSFEESGSAVIPEGAFDREAPAAQWQPPSAEEPAAPAIDINELSAEAEFYYQQGLFDEARQHYEKILEQEPNNQGARDRLAELSREKEEVQEFSKLAEAVEGLESAIPSGASGGELALSASDEEAVRSLMQDLKHLQQEEKGAHDEFPAFGAPAGEELDSSAASLGSGGDEFFDLAAELKEELGSTLEQVTADSSEDQSLDDILEDFKQGLETQAGMEDSDTHYNLGVSYKEMELLDDAIAEFQLTGEGEPKFIQSRYMLGLCYMEKGEFPKAIAELGNALRYSESLSGDKQERLGMRYDLALAYQGAGNVQGAIRELETLLGDDAGYRDAAAKVKELQQGAAIPLDQLKEDIEKEISAKFFEEGERIELEERAKKSEKVSG